MVSTERQAVRSCERTCESEGITSVSHVIETNDVPSDSSDSSSNESNATDNNDEQEEGEYVPLARRPENEKPNTF